MPRQARHTITLTTQKKTLAGVMFSPGAALAISLFAYYPLASYTSFIFAEGSAGGVAVRLLMVFTLAAVFLYSSKPKGISLGYLFLPATLFLFFYILRLLDNIFIQGIEIAPGPQVIFAILILNVILPCYILTYFRNDIREEDFAIAMVVLIAIFLVGLGLNLDELTQSAESRLTLERVNPIILGHISIGFLQFLIFFFRKSYLVKLTAIVAAPILLLVVILAQSRGPWVSVALATVFYLVITPGRQRLVAMALIGIFGIIAVFYGSEYIDIIAQRLMFTNMDSDESTLTHYQVAVGAWQQFHEDIFFGRYAVEMTTRFYPHNIFLEAPMAVGLLGGIPFFLHFLLSLIAVTGLVRSAKSSLIGKFVALAFVREAIANAFAGAIWGATGYWICSFVAIALWFGRRRLKTKIP